MFEQIALKSAEIAKRALGWYEPQLHQHAGRVVYKHEQGAGIGPILEPSVV